MLLDLNILNVTIAEELGLEFGAGMTVLTGETGAGKSLTVDALGLVLGDRAASGTVRHGCDRAEISATFDLSKRPDVVAWLREQDLDDDAGVECHLRRVISAKGRSKAFINGRNVALATLKVLGEQLVDIHGQHEHQSLLRARAQRALLDRFGGHAKKLDHVTAAYDSWYRLDQTVRTLTESNAQRNERLDLLRFQVQELDELNLGPDEYPQLAADQRRAANMASLAEGIQAAQTAIAGSETSAQAQITSARRALTPLVSVDDALDDVQGLFDAAQIQLDEAERALERYSEQLHSDPGEHERLERRLDQIGDIARKHRVPAEELHERAAALRGELDQLDHADERLSALTGELSVARTEYLDAARALTRARSRAARKLAAEVTKRIATLGMPDAQFDVVVNKRDAPGFGRHGMDDVTFSVAANPGEPGGPLSKVASGGELSRISLAISVVTADTGVPRCMVFDEVDAGIGGAVAQTVGEQLSTLAADMQVLCVTHHAQVASQAAHHWQVSKASKDGKTRSSVVALDGEDRIEELARMLGGARITKRTRDHAAELLRGAPVSD
ncbi:MAG: DNA repair protein RecN [Pseudomonadota bacterium]